MFLINQYLNKTIHKEHNMIKPYSKQSTPEMCFTWIGSGLTHKH